MLAPYLHVSHALGRVLFRVHELAGLGVYDRQTGFLALGIGQGLHRGYLVAPLDGRP